MAWYDDPVGALNSLFDSNPYPPPPQNIAGQAIARAAPTLDPGRNPATGRLDHAIIDTSQLPKSITNDPNSGIQDYADLLNSIGDMQRKSIEAYQPPARTGMQWIGDIMRAASVPIASYQGNRAYADNMQSALSHDADVRNSYAGDRAKMLLENSNDIMGNLGKYGMEAMAKKRDMVLQARQRMAQGLQTAAIEAAQSGKDPHEAQAQFVDDYAGVLEANGLGSVASDFRRAYPKLSAPAKAAPTLQNAPPSPPATSGAPGPIQVASDAPTPVPMPQGTSSVPDFAKGLRVAAGGSADMAAHPSEPAPQAQAPQPISDVPRWKQYQDLSRRLLDVDPERSKWYGEQAKELIKTRKAVDFKDDDQNHHWFWIDSADPSVAPVPVQPNEMAEAHQNRTKSIVNGIESGDLPPDTQGLYRYGAGVRAEIADRKLPLAKMQLQWQAAKAQVKGLNSDRLNRFVQLGSSVLGTMDDVSQLSKEMDQGGLTGLNALQLQALIHAEGNSPRGQLATKYLTAVNTLKEEFANLANGGFAPTESAWKLANDQINGNFGVKQMGASLTELKRLINYRLNAVSGLSTFGAGSANRYTGADGSRAIGSGIAGSRTSTPRPMPKVGDTVAGHVYKGGPVNDPASWEEIEGAQDNGPETQEAGE